MHSTSQQDIFPGFLSDSEVMRRSDILNIDKDFLQFYADITCTYKPTPLFGSLFQSIDTVVDRARMSRQTGSAHSNELSLNKEFLGALVSEMSCLPKDNDRVRGFIHDITTYFNNKLPQLSNNMAKTSEVFEPYSESLSISAMRTADACSTIRNHLNSLKDEIGFTGKSGNPPEYWQEQIGQQLDRMSFTLSAADEKVITEQVGRIFTLTQEKIPVMQRQEAEAYALRHQLEEERDVFRIEIIKAELTKRERSLQLQQYQRQSKHLQAGLVGIENLVTLAMKATDCNPKNIKKVQHYCEGGRRALEIGKNAAALVQQAIHGGMSCALLGPFGALAGSLYALYAWYNPEQDAMSQNLEQILQNTVVLSRQITGLHRAMDAHFAAVRAQLQALRGEIITRFDLLERSQQRRHEEILSILLDINLETKQQGERIRHSITSLHIDMQASLEAIYEQAYTLNRDEALGSLASAEPINAADYHRFVTRLCSHIAESKKTPLAGEFRLLNSRDELNDAYTARLAATLVQDGVERQINLMASMAANFTGISARGPFINPVVWAMRVQDLMNFLKHAPRHPYTQEQLQVFTPITAEGLHLEELICTLKRNQPLFNFLFTKYYESLTAIKNEMISILSRYCTSRQEPEIRENAQRRMQFLRTTVQDRLYPWHKELLLRRQETAKQQALVTSLTQTQGELNEAIRVNPPSQHTWEDLQRLLGEQKEELLQEIISLLKFTAMPISGNIGSAVIAFTADPKEYRFGVMAETMHDYSIQFSRAMKLRCDQYWLTPINARLAETQQQLTFCQGEEARVSLLAQEQESKSDDVIILDYLTRYRATLPIETHAPLQELPRTICTAAETEGTPLQQAIARANTFYVLINAYAALAFRQEYSTDPNLRYWLQNALWGTPQWRQQSRKPLPTTEEERNRYLAGWWQLITTTLPQQTRQAEAFLASYIVRAQKAEESKTLHAAHPVIDHTFNQLEQLRLLLFPTADFKLNGRSASRDEKIPPVPPSTSPPSAPPPDAASASAYAARLSQMCQREGTRIGTGIGESHGRRFQYTEYKVRGDGNCGFTVIGVSRSESVRILQALARRPEIRERLSEELLLSFHSYMESKGTEVNPSQYMPEVLQTEIKGIYEQMQTHEARVLQGLGRIRPLISEEQKRFLGGGSLPNDNIVLNALVNGQLSLPTRAAEVRMTIAAQEQYETLRNTFNRADIISAYINSYDTNGRGLWLGLWSMHYIAKTKGVGLQVWRGGEVKADRTKNLYLAEEYSVAPSTATTGTVNTVFDGAHFNFLVEESVSPAAAAGASREAKTTEAKESSPPSSTSSPPSPASTTSDFFENSDVSPSRKRRRADEAAYNHGENTPPPSQIRRSGPSPTLFSSATARASQQTSSLPHSSSNSF